MKNRFLEKYYILIAVAIFAWILISGIAFYKAVVLILEFIVILEVIKMVAEFIEGKRIRLRYVIDMFILFLLRDVVILITYPKKNYNDIIFILATIFIFFIFRFFTVFLSPNIVKKK